MKRSFAARVVPGLIMTAAAALPVATAAEIIARITPTSSSTLAAQQPAASSSTSSNGTSNDSAGGSSSSSGASQSTNNSGSAAASPSHKKPATPTPTPSKPAAAATPKTYAGGQVADQFGVVQATITVTGKKITNVSISAPMGDPRSASINSQAVPYLQQETLQAQSANINLISGATETSAAYLQSLQGALSQAGI